MKFLVLFSTFSVLSVLSITVAEPITPTFDAAQDTRILLLTRANRDAAIQLNFGDLNSILQSPFDRTKPLRVLTHGWGGDDTTDLVTGASEVLLEYYDFNVIIVDWGAGAQTINYAAAVARVRPVGAFFASYLDFLHENNLIDYTRMSIIGFSLGAHVCGFIGKMSNEEELIQLLDWIRLVLCSVPIILMVD